MFQKRSFKTFAAKEAEPSSGSVLRMSTFQRIAAISENLALGQQAREEAAARRAAKAAAAEQHRQKIAERVANDRKLQESIKAKREMVRAANAKMQRQHKQLMAEEDKQGEEAYRLGMSAMREHVIEASKLDARLDNEEEGEAAKRRAEGAASRKATRDLLEQVRLERLAAKRAAVESTRTALSQGRNESKQRLDAWKASVARTEKAEQERIRRQRQDDLTRFLGQAEKTKLGVTKIRESAKAEKQRLLDQKVAAGRLERANDYLVYQEKSRILEDNKKRVAQMYEMNHARADQVELVIQLASEHASLDLVDPVIALHLSPDKYSVQTGDPDKYLSA
mmetsp:Transcript_63227/g.140913  ORF Transcript_63227/g.140913 Transcript_63227/m.140913 type:complete len:337 (-) Transcript_63227:42-1052(-)|eukprot:CAMPEP_0181184088 /NCGR_PEP_ID=MMETSP1096-20121128/8778_1 /TAXON_ID=156174 ORGANISM="Chrysochromulina ericina, Strain CCMP281" /NCGR_SAMPLE_ID=MMETSP1096 /ASSEMBLY_ACC=CAM_ASM_000453 /LENGTH=336 /DNA_ID=CAMNT_0023272823 /DNA_START=145 /DNA_END=1155 /DNA_ORIENTATION=+